MASIIRIIKKRISVRTFSPAGVDGKSRKILIDYCVKNSEGPFGNKVRFVFVEETDPAMIRKLGTYGMIKGATLYLAGTVRKSALSLVDFGYCMENAVLKATELGLGTCWLGGFLNRGTFAARTGLRKGEIIPAVTPVGYPSETPRFFEKAVRKFVKADNRRKFQELFFDGSPDRPLERKTCGKYGEALESVRLAPSASNKQPWRIVRAADGKAFHFFLDEDKLYQSAFRDIRIQDVDMGIAMCHFELSSREMGLKGGWNLPGADDSPKSSNWRFIATWKSV